MLQRIKDRHSNVGTVALTIDSSSNVDADRDWSHQRLDVFGDDDATNLVRIRTSVLRQNRPALVFTVEVIGTGRIWDFDCKLRGWSVFASRAQFE